MVLRCFCVDKNSGSYRSARLNRAVESHVHLASELPLLVPLDIGIRGMDFLLFLEICWMFVIRNVSPHTFRYWNWIFGIKNIFGCLESGVFLKFVGCLEF